MGCWERVDQWLRAYRSGFPFPFHSLISAVAYRSQATIFVNMQRLQSGIPVTIGPPLPTVRAYILNDRKELQPPNTFGNIYVAGVHVSRGYLDMPEVTAKSFSPDPFFPESTKERMYDTGDVGFWGIDGSVNCCGRKDRQVKLRGFRINLDGVSNIASLRMPTVRHAAAIVKDGAITLCVEPEDVNTEELRAHLKDFLPPHSVPRRIYAIEHMPLSANGKLDVKRLAAVEMRNGAPLTNGVVKDKKQQPAKKTTANGINSTSAKYNDSVLEKLIGQEWQHLLGLDPSEPLSKTDDFVLLGGDSIKQLNLAARLRAVLGIPIKVKDIIRASTLGDLVAVVVQHQEQQKSKNGVIHAPLVDSARSGLGYKELSPPETDWVYRYCNSQSQSTFNVPYVARLSPAVDWQRLANALGVVLNRHRMLKSRFVIRSKSVERILPDQAIEVVRTTQTIDAQAVINRPFKLDNNESLVHAIVSPSLLVLCISHILCDLTAMDTLLHEVTAIYHGLDLPPVEREYFDVTWHQPTDPDKQQFWTDYLRGFHFVRRHKPNGMSGNHDNMNGNRPSRDLNNRKLRSYSGTSRTTSLSDGLYRRLVISSAKNGFTFHQFGMAVTGLVLHFLCDRDDVVLGCPFVNRPSVEDRLVIGLFLEPLPVRISTKAQDGNGRGPPIHEFVQSVRRSSQSALAHSMPWADLMHHLGLPFPSAEPQIFSCCVTFHDGRGSTPPLAIEGVKGQHVSAEGAKFPLLFEWHAHRVAHAQEKLTVRLEYDTDWLSTQFIEVTEALLVECFRMLLEEDSSRHDEVKQRLHDVLGTECTRLGMAADEIHEMAQEYLTLV